MVSIAKTQLSQIGIAERVEVGLIHPPMFPLRTELKDIDNLASSIRELGLLQPLLVRPTSNGLELVCGYRRLMACKSLRWHSVPCIIRDLDNIETFELSLAENVQKESLDPVEEAIAFKRYTSENGHGAVVALSKKIGKSPEFICHRMALLKLPQETLKDVKCGMISASTAYEMLGLSKMHANSLITELSNSKCSSRDVRLLARRLREEGLDDDEKTSFPTPMSRTDTSRNQTKNILRSENLIYRLAIIRLDTLIDSCNHPTTREHLLRQRLRLHNMIDECIVFQKIERQQK